MARGTHKVNPIGFRIGVNKNWPSRWYATKVDYSDKLLGDRKARKLISEKLKSAGVASIIIKRFVNKILIEVNVARPGVVIGRSGAGINTLKDELSKLLKQPVDIKPYEVKNPDTIAKLVAENIAMQCERRVAPKMAIQKAIDAAKATGLIKGISVRIGGRIRGADMARVEKASWGFVPRHTIRADIDYAFAEAQVPRAGKHGVKVWINKGEKTTYSID
ncbi:MAG: 30S ribosomal protein S3 [Candidatus Dojkabacteria bacterium]